MHIGKAEIIKSLPIFNAILQEVRPFCDKLSVHFEVF